MTLSDAARSGNKLTLLKALRDRIATELEDCPTRDLSPLTRRLQDIVNEIEELEEIQRQEAPGERRGARQSAWTPGDSL